MELEQRIRNALANKDVLLMTHIVLGYPSLAANREVIAQMTANGVDLIEMQIPFSEPIADGPVILKANQEAIGRKIKVRECLEFAAEMTATHAIPFLFMTYYNIIFRFGPKAFIKKAADLGITGLIVPDLPPEEGRDYLSLARAHDIAPILILAPTSTTERMQYLGNLGAGFIYCVARKGVTGSLTRFNQDISAYLARCRQATSLPLAVGFGLRTREDVEFLIGKADIAVIGSETIRLVDREGPAAVGPFIAGLK